MKVGRNAPCPCGSGKKYKKCCLPKEESRRAAFAMASTREIDQRRSVEQQQPAPPAKPQETKTEAQEQTEEEKYWIRFWDDFKKAQLDQKLALAREAIKQRDDFDGEWAFELVSSLEEPLRKAERVPELEELLDLIATRRPQAYEEEGGWLSLCRVENALLLPSLDLRTPLLELAPRAARVIDPFFSLIARLMYHGKDDDLIATLELAWIHLRDSDQVLSRGKEELRGIMLWLLLDRHLDSRPTMSPDDPDFLKATEPYRKDEGRPWWDLAIEQRAGRRGSDWQQQDFNPLQNRDGFNERVFLLSVELATELHGRWEWPRPKAELVREQIFHFLLDRGAETTKERKKPKKKGAATNASDSSPFCSLLRPKHARQFMHEQLNSGYGYPHKAAAFSQALPLWLQFLNERGLLDEREAQCLYGGLKDSCAVLPDEVNVFTYDLEMMRDTESAWHSKPPFQSF
jgi:hypothetical protein